MNLPRTVELLEDGIAVGEQAGVQLCVAVRGEVVAEVALGEARPGVPMTAETIVRWMSAGKPITAAAVLRLVERGWLGLDDRITLHLPEFAGGGKDGITIRHVLTHTAGLHAIDEAAGADSIPSDWVAGERAAYDPRHGWDVLGELVARIEELPFPEAIRSLVLDPCGMSDSFCGGDADVLDDRRSRLGVLYERLRGGLVPRMEMIEPPHLTAVSPGGNFRGPVRELVRFYEQLRRGLSGDEQTLLKPATVAEMTARQRAGLFDETFQQTIDFGLGVIVDSKRYGADPVSYGFGPSCSDRTFGHGGVQSSIGFCDPEHDLVVAWVANGQIGEPRHQRRNRAINTAIYEDLGLA
jgi:CubicO group peptidase (beta-lactamase class C family)